MKTVEIDLKKHLKSVLPDPNFYKILLEIQELAEKRGEFLYFAGGVVRDYLLKTLYKRKIPKAKDVDLVLQGNLEEFLKELLKRVKGEILFKSQFLTYKVKIILDRKEYLIDFVTSRREIYEDVAKLPIVYPSEFKDDILRRDFTINALLIGLSSPYKGLLIDLVNGMEDLEKGLIKPLHLHSFVDDPTRIFRGIRYKVRLNFSFSQEFFLALEKCFEKSALEKLSGTRLANELKLYLTKEPKKNLKILLDTTYNLNIFEKAGLKTEKKFLDLVLNILRELKKELSSSEKEKFFLLSLINPNFLEDYFRLGFTDSEIKKIKEYLEGIQGFIKDWGKLSLWERVKFFEKIPVPYLLVFSLHFPGIRKEVIKFLKEYRKIKPELTGKDLIEMGIKEGKEIGKILELLRKEKLEGRIKTKEDEKKFCKSVSLE